ncbi:CLIP-associating protein 1 [Nymphon striatum]|nr:CLIP-associating protein 1 [Nymphon striatum]
MAAALISKIVVFKISFKILNELEKNSKNQELLFDICTMDWEFFFSTPNEWSMPLSLNICSVLKHYLYTFIQPINQLQTWAITDTLLKKLASAQHTYLVEKLLRMIRENCWIVKNPIFKYGSLQDGDSAVTLILHINKLHPQIYFCILILGDERFSNVLKHALLLPENLPTHTDIVDLSNTILKGKSASKRASSAPPMKEWFIKSFEDVPKVQLFSARELDTEFTKIKDFLNNANNDWEKRAELLKKFRSYLLAGAADYDELYPLLRNLEQPFQLSIRDLRSQVVREACITVAYISQQLGSKVDHFCEAILPCLINLIPNCAKVMSSSGIVTIRFIVQYTHSSRLIPIITINTSAKAKEIRKNMCEVLDQLLHTWQTHPLERHIAILQDAIKRGISDADPEARASARKAFWGFADHFKEQADNLLSSLEMSKQRMLHDEFSMSNSSSNNSLNTMGRTFGSSQSRASSYGGSTENLFRGSSTRSSLRSGIPTVTSPKSEKGNPGSPFRSNSAIDMNALRRAKAIRAGPGFASAARLPRGSVASLPRPRKPANVMVSSVVVSSPDNYARGRTRGVSQSQPGSRSASPSSRLNYGMYGHSRHGHGDGDGSRTPGRVRRKSGIPRSTSTSRESSPTRSMYASYGGHERKYSGGRRPSFSERSKDRTTPTRTTPVLAEKILLQSQEAEVAMADALRVPLVRHRSYDRSFNDHSDESETSSICSERSFSSYGRSTDDVVEILRNCSSTHWSDRKEGLLGLENLFHNRRMLNPHELKRVTDLLTRMFMDPNNKIFNLFLDVLNEVIMAHKRELHHWLYALLTRLINKLGTDPVPSVQTKLYRTMDIIRDSFPYDLQFNSIMRFLVDQTQTPNVKAKSALLNYLRVVLELMEPHDFHVGGDTVHAVTKIICWTMDNKNVEVRKTAQMVIIALFSLNTAGFSQMLSSMPKTYQQDSAFKLLSMQLRRGTSDPCNGSFSMTPPSPISPHVQSPISSSPRRFVTDVFSMLIEKWSFYDLISILCGVTMPIEEIHEDLKTLIETNFSRHLKDNVFRPIISLKAVQQYLKRLKRFAVNSGLNVRPGVDFAHTLRRFCNKRLQHVINIIRLPKGIDYFGQMLFYQLRSIINSFLSICDYCLEGNGFAVEDFVTTIFMDLSSALPENSVEKAFVASIIKKLVVQLRALPPINPLTRQKAIDKYVIYKSGATSSSEDISDQDELEPMDEDKLPEKPKSQSFKSSTAAILNNFQCALGDEWSLEVDKMKPMLTDEVTTYIEPILRHRSNITEPKASAASASTSGTSPENQSSVDVVNSQYRNEDYFKDPAMSNKVISDLLSSVDKLNCDRVKTQLDEVLSQFLTRGEGKFTDMILGFASCLNIDIVHNVFMQSEERNFSEENYLKSMNNCIEVLRQFINQHIIPLEVSDRKLSKDKRQLIIKKVDHLIDHEYSQFFAFIENEIGLRGDLDYKESLKLFLKKALDVDFEEDERAEEVSPIKMEEDEREELTENINGAINNEPVANDDADQSWTRVVPPEWVPIIKEDIIKQRNASRQQGPLSEAYICAMPTKRRKIMREERGGQMSASSSLPNALRQAISASGVHANNEILHRVVQEATSNAILRDSYEKQFKEDVNTKLDHVVSFIYYRQFSIPQPYIEASETPRQDYIVGEPEVVFCNVVTGDVLDNKDVGGICAKDGAAAHPTKCDYFYDCWKGAPNVGRCPMSMLFNEDKLYCDYPKNVNCGDRKISGGMADMKNECPYTWGLFPNLEDCTAYYHCSRGRKVNMARCPKGLLFDPHQLTCNWPEKVNCRGASNSNKKRFTQNVRRNGEIKPERTEDKRRPEDNRRPEEKRRQDAPQNIPNRKPGHFRENPPRIRNHKSEKI